MILYENLEFTSSSTGLSLGNQVDGLPGALHTEALGTPHGGYVPAADDTLDKTKIQNIFETVISMAQTFRSSSSSRSVRVLIMAEVILEIISNLMIYSRVQFFMRVGNDVFL